MPADTPGAPGLSRRIGDLRIRFLSALALGPPILVSAWLGGIVFMAIVLLGAVLAVREWVRMVEPAAGPMPVGLTMVAAGAAVVASTLWGVDSGLWALLAVTAALPAVHAATGAKRWALLALSVPYVALAGVVLVWLRDGQGEEGRALVLFLLLAVWATDIGAYAAGRSIGGPRLAPRISPNKTWVGLAGGVAFAALVGSGMAAAAGADRPLMAALVAGTLGLAAQAGDLLESYVKRRHAVKDTGRLIPGHGGVLDRIDGLVVAAPVYALMHGFAGEAFRWW